jgi:hypothetical protein
MVRKALAGLLLVPLLVIGCATPYEKFNDPMLDTSPKMLAATYSVVEIPAAGASAAWAGTSTQFPGYFTLLVDPWNLQTFIWIGFTELWRVPINPFYYLVDNGDQCGCGDIKAIEETVTAHYTPVPGGGDGGRYWRARVVSNFRNFQTSWYTIKYAFLNTNSSLMPYDSYYPDELEREKTTIHYTIDYHLFGFDWDDPYVSWW